jgi:hypothetical protein
MEPGVSRRYRYLGRVLPELHRFQSDEERKVAMRQANSMVWGSPRPWLWLFLLVITAVGLIFARWQLEEEYPVVEWICLAATSFFAGTWIWFCRSELRHLLREQLVDKGVAICLRCGYDLRGQVDPRCPECGTPFDERLLGRSLPGGKPQ